VFGSTILPGLSLPVLAKTERLAVRCRDAAKRNLDVVMAWSVDRLGRTHVTYRYFDSSTVGTFRT
jgi:hypothetical protein